jgi:hypothetical protein
VLAATMGKAFPHVLRHPIEPENTLLVASDGPIGADRLRREIPDLPDELQPVALAAASELGPPLPGGSVYTDDKAPVEWLIDRSIIDYAAGND